MTASISLQSVCNFNNKKRKCFSMAINTSQTTYNFVIKAYESYNKLSTDCTQLLNL